VDLHPAAKLGKGILIDHGTGVVIGETAVVGDNVSILQGVTLGGTGKDCGDRHPKIGKNVLIGAHSTILGNITIGKGAMIAAGSLVLKNVAPHTMVAGAPAREVGKTRVEAPALDMKQELESSANGAASLDGGGTADAPAASEADTSKIKSQTKVRRGGGGDAARWADRLPEGDGSWYI
jgi:serine O-acetyltransferase